MLPLTIVQLQAIFGFGARPIRLDYLVLLWATVPWLWLPRPIRSAGSEPATWRAAIAGWRSGPQPMERFRSFLGLEAR